MAGLNFSEQMKDDLRKIGAKASSAVSTSAKIAFRTAVGATPVDTGRARAGWRLSKTRRSSYVPTPGNKPKPTTPNFRFAITRDKRVYLFNNVPYVSFLEHGEGPGRRIAHKMLAKAQVKFHSELRRRLNRI